MATQHQPSSRKETGNFSSVNAISCESCINQHYRILNKFVISTNPIAKQITSYHFRTRKKPVYRKQSLYLHMIEVRRRICHPVNTKYSRANKRGSKDGYQSAERKSGTSAEADIRGVLALEDRTGLAKID